MSEWTMKAHLEEHDAKRDEATNAEIERLKEEVVFGFYEGEYPCFAQGYGKGINELSSPVTAQEVTSYIIQIIELKRRVAQLEADSQGYRQ